MENTKMIRTAKLLDIAANIGEKLMWLLILLLIVICAAAMFMPEAFASSITSFSVGDISLSVEDIEGSADVIRKYMISQLGTALIDIILTCIGIRVVRKILKPMKEGRPFETRVSDSLRTLARIVLFGSIAIFVLKTLSNILILQSVDFSQFFNQDVVSGMTVKVNFDLSNLLFAGVLYLLSYVFRYGEELQRESDETL